MINHFANAAIDVVAMAALAGGLTALSQVLTALPADFPAAILVVQHLDPRHRSLMAENLSRSTSLKIQEAKEGDTLAPKSIKCRVTCAPSSEQTRTAAVPS